MTPTDLRAWQSDMRMSNTDAEKALGISRATYARHISPTGKPRRTVALACAALAAGLQPWTAKIQKPIDEAK